MTRLSNAFAALLMAVFALWPAQAQETPSNLGQQHLDVFLGQAKIIQLNRVVDDVSSSNADVVKVEKVAGSDQQISLTGIGLGKANVTVNLADRIITYQVTVSPQPQRVYVNVSENKRLTFENDIDAYTVSTANILNVRQPGDNVLVVEAIRQGRTSLNVESGGEVYRYFISTFQNRGADLLEIENAFASKGYKFLQVAFENDQATITGTVPTQEELDDAVRIVRQYTPYVNVKAVVGALGVDYTESEEERVIINNIKRIADIPGLIVKVKYPQPEEVITSTYSRVAGNPVLNTSVTDNETRLTTDTLELPPADAGLPGGSVERPVQEGTIERITRRQDLSVPEKIFLFGEVRDDLEEAKAIRVARTFCPLVVSFVTVKDPIQLRMKMRFVLVNVGKMKDVGFRWQGTGTDPITGIADGGTYASAGATAFSGRVGPIGGPTTFLQSLTYAFQFNANVTLRLLEEQDYAELLDEGQIMVSNNQIGAYFDGEQIPYVASFAITDAGFVVPSIAFLDVGLQVFMWPLKLEQMSQQSGETIEVLSGDGSTSLANTNLSPYIQLSTAVGNQGTVPTIDETVQYIDENGLIGVTMSTSLSALTSLDDVGNGFTAPRTEDRSVISRAYLRDGQSIVLNGVLDEQFQKEINSLPFFNEIPLFGWIFDNTDTSRATSEFIVIYTPEIVRMSDSDKGRLPEPNMPEVAKKFQQYDEIVPTIEPVMYNPDGTQIVRPDLGPAPSLQSVQAAPGDGKVILRETTRGTKGFNRRIVDDKSVMNASLSNNDVVDLDVQQTIVEEDTSASTSRSEAPSLFASPQPSAELRQPAVDTPAASDDTPYSEQEELPATLP